MVIFEKRRLMPAPGFLFTVPRLIFITHTLHHNTTLTHKLIFEISSYLHLHITLQRGTPKWYKNRKYDSLATVHSKAGPKSCSLKGLHYTQMHTDARAPFNRCVCDLYLFAYINKSRKALGCIISIFQKS